MDRTSPIYLQRFFPCKEVLIAMVPMVCISFYLYGIRPVLVMALSITSAMIFDFLMHKAREIPYHKTDLSAAVTGGVLGLMMSAAVPFWMVVVGNFVAIVMVKHAFGGYGSNIFNPAAVGVAFLCLMWPEKMFAYAAPQAALPIAIPEGYELFSSPLAAMKAGGVPYLMSSELLVGNFAGPIGAAGVVIMVGVGAYLLLRRVIDWRLTVSFLGAVALMAFFFPRIHDTRLNSMLFELCCGEAMFCSLFVVTEPVTAPKRELSKYIYGALVGVVAMLFRYFGAYEIGVPFAMIAMGALSSFIDRRVIEYQGRYTVAREITGGAGQ